MKYWIITACLLISNGSFASPGDSVSLSLAMIEKNIFQSHDDMHINELLFEKSRIQVENDISEEAIRTLGRIDTTTFSNRGMTDYYYQLAVAKVLSNRFDQALDELEKISSQNDSIKTEVRFLTIFILNEMGNLEDCKSVLIEDSTLSGCRYASPSLLPTTIDYRDPEKASRLSAIFPGAGQVYDGHVGKGLLSFTLTAGFLAFGVYNFTSGYYAMSVVSGLFPALKFYSGGKRLAENLAEKENDRKRNELKLLYRSHIYNIRCK